MRRTRLSDVIRLPLPLLAALAIACTGSIDESVPGGTDDDPEHSGPPVAVPEGLVAARTGIQRLTRAELRDTIRDLFAQKVSDPQTMLQQLLPEDARPFDNDYSVQQPGMTLIEAMSDIAEEVARQVISDPLVRDAVTGCKATAPGCMNQFISSFGRHALRRPLANTEVAELASLANKQNGFDAGVEVVIRVLLQDLEFQYRIVRGHPTTTPDLVQLTSWETASRLSYLFWGTMPNDALFALAQNDVLKTPEQIGQATRSLLNGDFGNGKRSRDRVGRFHAMWLGYDGVVLPSSTLGSKMLQETSFLLNKIIFDDHRSWFDIFTSKQTYIDDELATFYGHGMAKPGAGAKWVQYQATGRQGILSHGTFLSVAASPSDTSPTLRGKTIRNRLLCQEIPPPMAGLMLNGMPVDTSKPPEPAAGECRIDIMNKMQLSPGCIQCHQQMDYIGLGLENYDRNGKYRSTDTGKTACVIKGEGQFLSQADGSLTPFQGPAGLSDMLVNRESERVGSCLVQQYLHFAMGRDVRSDDDAVLQGMVKKFEDGGRLFDEMMIGYASMPGFGYRLVE